MSNLPQNNPYDAPLDDKLKEHSYDGIHEYDKRLPNWWLFTLYIAIAFSVVYWIMYYDARLSPSDDERLAGGMSVIEERRMANSMDSLTDEKLWELAGNADFVAEGKASYQSTCVACHGMNLEGGIGLALNDSEWKYGGKPLEIMKIVAQGSPDVSKGMVAWEPTLGSKKVSQIVAYILSTHTQGTDGSAQ